MHDSVIDASGRLPQNPWFALDVSDRSLASFSLAPERREGQNSSARAD